MEIKSIEKIPKFCESLTEEDLNSIKGHLKNHEPAGLPYEEFQALLSGYKLHFSDDAFADICLRIDLDRNDAIHWSELVDYLIVELQQNDSVKAHMSIIPPISKPPRVLPITLNRNIVVIGFLEDFGSENQSGHYVTVGCFGELCFWSTDWILKQSQFIDKIPVTISPVIEVSDECEVKRLAKTLIFSAVTISDLRIICVASACRDLRFYDVSSRGHCSLKLYIRSFPSSIKSLFYQPATRSIGAARLIIGDMAGSVRVISFLKNFEVNFRSDLSIRQYSYHEIVKGKADDLECIEFLKVHAEIVQQVAFIADMNSFVSASERLLVAKTRLPNAAIVNISNGSKIGFKMNEGATCLAYDAHAKRLWTGGPDGILYSWNPIAPTRHDATLVGHTSGIKHIFLQDQGSRIYSIDKHKIIKVWGARELNLLQTFLGFKVVFTDDVQLAAFYHDASREFAVASTKIAVIKCMKKINLDLTDGSTDVASISVILLNELFHLIVTCSLSSSIIIWNVWEGRIVNLITQAHTRGNDELVAISAGCFDPKKQVLLTAGVDGSLKIWNFTEGVCLRSIKNEVKCRVTSVFWSHQRIFAVGSNRKIVEFQESVNHKNIVDHGKLWPECHSGDIVCAAMRLSDLLVTSCTDGDLIFWRFETGQPYLRFNVEHPLKSLSITYGINYQRPATEKKDGDKQAKKKQQDSSEKTLVKCMLSLNNRASIESNGTLLVSLSNGNIQIWSLHDTTGGFLADFNAGLMENDFVTTMATDSKNVYLFTGSTFGSISVWNIKNFCSIREESFRKSYFRKSSMKFSRYQMKPEHFITFKGHNKPITGLIFSNKNQILISSSSDKSVRLWNVKGQYIGTLGSPIKWVKLSAYESTPSDFPYRIPADLKLVFVYTTAEQNEIKLHEAQDANEKTLESKLRKDLESALKILAENSEMKTFPDFCKPLLDNSLPHTRIYNHLKLQLMQNFNVEPKMSEKCLKPNDLPKMNF